MATNGPKSKASGLKLTVLAASPPPEWGGAPDKISSHSISLNGNQSVPSDRGHESFPAPPGLELWPRALVCASVSLPSLGAQPLNQIFNQIALNWEALEQ